MIKKHINKSGFVDAYIEWQTVDDRGHLDPNGIFLHIYDLWVHPSIRRTGNIEKFIDRLDKDKRLAKVRYVYWKRKNRWTRSYRRSTALRRIKKYEMA